MQQRVSLKLQMLAVSRTMEQMILAQTEQTLEMGRAVSYPMRSLILLSALPLAQELITVQI